MSQKPEGTLPLYLNLDVAYEKLLPSESVFIKGTEVGISKNPLTNTGNPTGEGQNALDLSPTRSNAQIPGAIAPEGYNREVASYYSATTKETYYCNYNDEGDNGIYLIDGDTGIWTTVIIDSNLPFTPYQEDRLDNRMRIRVLYDQNKNILEKFLIYTNGAGWQGYISVIASIKTNGFDDNQNPYWTLLQPHFDRRELLEWAVRPPMYNPTVVTLANTAANANAINRIIDQAFQFAYRTNYTDGRPSAFSPYSQPLIVKSEDYLNNPDILPKTALLTLYAGSCMVESIDIMVRYTAKKQLGIPSTETWGDWEKYTRIYKFTGMTGSPSDVLATDYWLRTNPWSEYNYDPIQNTIQFVFDNSILSEAVDQDDADRIQNDIPIRSMGLTDINDAAALGDNLRNYNNLPFSTINNLDVAVIEKPSAVCPLPLRKITLYAVAGRPGPSMEWESQVGYYDGQDTQVRWGSLSVDTANSDNVAAFNVLESKEFGLDFADHSAFVCYAKGTPFYVVGEWYLVDAANNLTKLPALLDFSDNDVLSGVQTAFLSQKYYVCVFNFELPAGRYDFCIGRHNINLSQDFRSVSSYVYGIANSRIRQPMYGGKASFVTPASLVNGYNKEMQIDCTNSDVDVWGNGADLFFIYCPYPPNSGGKFRFIEGYIKESANNQLGVELFPYTLNVGANDWGKITDKNGFYWAYTSSSISDTSNIEVQCRLNCAPFNFEIPTNASGAVLGPISNGYAYLSDHNGGVVGDCNRVLITGKITDLTGTIPYQNISVSIANGGTVTTASDGTFTLIVHNGQSTPRVDNVYVSAAGNFLITLSGCAPMPLTIYNETLVPCFNCTVRRFPLPINFQVLIQGGTQYSLKQNASYQVTCHIADLAGRVGFENVIATVPVPSFLQRNDLLATFFRTFVKGKLNLQSDYAWLAFSVSNQANVSRYFQWVGDSINYIDNQGNVVNDPSTAVVISIAIDSLYNYNVAKNFSLLSSYQFSPDDRIRFIDDGNGNLLNTGAITNGVDLPILGTNYNQAMQTAGIIPSSNTVPIVNTTINNSSQTTVNTGGSAPSTTTSFATEQNNISITLYVKFDARLSALQGDTGFWIEIYTPAQQAQEIPYNELQWYPVINGEIAEFEGNNNGVPEFSFPTQFDLPFWDTYLYPRNITIPNVGDKFLNHPFESPNISDSFGANVTSGGRKLEKNDDAQQQWAQSEVAKSDAFIGNGILNGIGTFRTENKKDFSQYPYGAIQAMYTQRGIIFILCENDWFTVTFDFHFTYPNAQGVMIVNLDNNLSTPNQKIGGNFGIHPEDIATLNFCDKEIFWFDRRNEVMVKCDYRDAENISDIIGEGDRKMGVMSYFIKKTQWMTKWNNTASIKDRMDVVSGIDQVRKNVYLTFRRRRNNSNDPRSFINQRRNIDLSQQETIVYSINSNRWRRFQGFAPEGYGVVHGNQTGLEFLMYAGGLPYGRSQGETPPFLNFFGVQTEAVMMTVFNQPPDKAKVFQSMSFDSNLSMFADLIFTGQDEVFSYIPVNFFQQKEGIFYAPVLRDMYSYPKPGPIDLFRSMLYDGSRISDVYSVMRFVTDPNTLGQYFQLNNIFATYTKNYPDKK